MAANTAVRDAGDGPGGYDGIELALMHCFQQLTGAVREGSALLQGLLRRGRCRRKMRITYTGVGGNIPADPTLARGAGH